MTSPFCGRMHGHGGLTDIDEAAVQALMDVGGPELFMELVDDFVPFAHEVLATIRAGSAAEDCRAVADAAHSIKSASASLGALTLSEVATRLEAVALAADIDSVRSLLPEFERAELAAQAGLSATAKRAGRR